MEEEKKLEEEERLKIGEEEKNCLIKFNQFIIFLLHVIFLFFIFDSSKIISIYMLNLYPRES